MLTLKSVIQLTAFTDFETGRKLNSVPCNYVHFSHQPLLLSLKREVFPSLLSNDSQTMSRFIIFVRANQNQIFDDEIGCKYYVKNLWRLFNNNIAKERVWLYWVVENPHYLKMKWNNERWFSLFFYLLISYSSHSLQYLHTFQLPSSLK